MGFLDRFKKGRDRRRRDHGEERYRRREREPLYDEPNEPEEREASSLLVDHRLEFIPGEDYERNLRGMEYVLEVENGTDYPMGNIRVDFPPSMKLGSFGSPEATEKMLDPGDRMKVRVPFKPSYRGGRDDFDFEIVFFDFNFKVEEKVVLSSEPIKVVVPKFKPEKMDEDSYRFLTADLYRWSIETDVIEVPPGDLFSSLSGRMEKIGFHTCNEMINEKVFRGISQLAASDGKGRKWAAQVQVIGKGKESKLLMYTYGERPLNSYSLAVKALLKYENRNLIVTNLLN